MSRLNIFNKKKKATEKKSVSKVDASKERESVKNVSPIRMNSPLGRTVLKRPIASEKAHDLMGQTKYVFLVEVSANKPMVKESVEKRYGVAVKSVNIVNLKGKPKRFAGIRGYKSSFKKAIVTLNQGQKIEIT